MLNERNEKISYVHERKGDAGSAGFLGFHKGMGLKTQVLGLAGGLVPLLLKREEW